MNVRMWIGLIWLRMEISVRPFWIRWRNFGFRKTGNLLTSSVRVSVLLSTYFCDATEDSHVTEVWFPVLEPTQPRIQLVAVVFIAKGKAAQPWNQAFGHVVSKLRISGAIPPIFTYVFMAWTGFNLLLLYVQILSLSSGHFHPNYSVTKYVAPQLLSLPISLEL